MICRHFGLCGGCSIQDLAYAQQLSSKESVLRDCLRAAIPALREGRGPFASPLFVPIEDLAGTPWHFRQKVAFVFGSGRGGRGLVMGHYEKGSRRIVSVE